MPDVPCTHCGWHETHYAGLQKGVDKASRRMYTMPVYQCDNPAVDARGQYVCQTSFGVKSERRFMDDGTLVECERNEAA